MRAVLLSFLALAGCPGQDDTGDLGPFCQDLTDADQWRFQGQGGGTTSGSFQGTLLTTASDDFSDPAYVATVTYTVENVDVGGTTQQSGRTSMSGTFANQAAAAEGTWLFKAGSVVAGHTCAAEMEFEVEAGRNTVVCPVLRCDD